MLIELTYSSCTTPFCTCALGRFTAIQISRFITRATECRHHSRRLLRAFSRSISRPTSSSECAPSCTVLASFIRRTCHCVHAAFVALHAARTSQHRHVCVSPISTGGDCCFQLAASAGVHSPCWLAPRWHDEALAIPHPPGSPPARRQAALTGTRAQTHRAQWRSAERCVW